MRFYSYLNTSLKILRSYDGSMPLSHFLKQYFSGNKKHGSKDRKFITHACYCYFRLGHALPELSIEEKLKAAIFLCNETAGEWSALYPEEWLNHWSSLLADRIRFVKSSYNSFSLDDVFRFTTQPSEGIDITHFVQSHFVQPDLFLRIRPHCREHVLQTLRQNDLRFTSEADDCVRLPPTINVEKFFSVDKEVVVQDYSSQQIKRYFEIIQQGVENLKSQTPNSKSQSLNPKSQIPTPVSVWDCCAGSGGKSILAHDTLQNIQLTATDIRPSIIHNLEKRFREAGIKNYKAGITDIANGVPKALLTVAAEASAEAPGSSGGFDLIICDAPCTGSGTWSRTPEQIIFFDENKIDYYAALQRRIVSNAIPLLRAGGYFLYITCSVFGKENEEIVSFIKSQFHLQLIKMEVLDGYQKKADTMFAALFNSIIAEPG